MALQNLEGQISHLIFCLFSNFDVLYKEKTIIAFSSMALQNLEGQISHLIFCSSSCLVCKYVITVVITYHASRNHAPEKPKVSTLAF